MEDIYNVSMHTLYFDHSNHRGTLYEFNMTLMTYVTSFAKGLQLSLIEHEIIELYKIFSVLGLGRRIRHIGHNEKLQPLYDENVVQ
jgi:hypothetical protein